MVRFFSLLIRKFQSKKKQKEVLRIFEKWNASINLLPTTSPSKKLLVIRLDDIGDYIVFRNFLGAFKLSANWTDYTITLLGNTAWKNLFEAFDKDKVDEVVWVDKRQYFEDEIYRNKTWNDLRNQSFEIVINPSRTRPLLLDDACALATGAVKKIASPNTFKYTDWNKASDKLYHELFCLEQTYIHEFIFNKKFAEWCCNINLTNEAPRFEEIEKKYNSDYIMFFIGAASGSRRWTVNRWIELVNLFTKTYSYKIFITGGNADIVNAKKITAQVKAENIAGKNSLTETINLIANAKLLITNNTMAAHAAVAAETPVVIVANGDNYFRFTDYKFLNNKNIVTIYTDRFLKDLKKYSSDLIFYEAVSADIATISATKVFEAAQKILS